MQLVSTPAGTDRRERRSVRIQLYEPCIQNDLFAHDAGYNLQTLCGTRFNDCSLNQLREIRVGSGEDDLNMGRIHTGLSAKHMAQHRDAV